MTRFAKHKFRNTPTVVNGRRYDAKAEARYAQYLTHQQGLGVVVGFLEQVPFRFPDGTKYVADFLAFLADGSVELSDIKGVETEVFKIKKRLMAHHYPWVPLRIIPASKVPK